MRALAIVSCFFLIYSDEHFIRVLYKTNEPNDLKKDDAEEKQLEERKPQPLILDKNDSMGLADDQVHQGKRQDGKQFHRQRQPRSC